MRITHFKKYIQKYMENGECFYKDVVRTFLAKVSSLSDVHIREQNPPSKIQMKQFNAFWLKRIKIRPNPLNLRGEQHTFPTLPQGVLLVFSGDGIMDPNKHMG
jgi:hypothetical protein